MDIGILPEGHPLYTVILQTLECMMIRTSAGKRKEIELETSLDNFNSIFPESRDSWVNTLGKDFEDYLETLLFFLLTQLTVILDDTLVAVSDDSTLTKPVLAKRRPNFPRGTVERLESWLLAHPDNPYPSSKQKEILSQDLSLSIKQINDWFINARRRKLPRC